MYKILIATDFSSNANEAAKFGQRVAEKLNATISFVHVYSYPVIHTEFPEMIDYKAFEDAKQSQMKHWMKQWDQLDPKPEIHLISGISFYDEIQEFLKKHTFDMLIIGMTGVSNIGGMLLGSNTLSLISHSPIPVLAIPQVWDEQKEIEQLAFAFDGKPISNPKSITFLEHFAATLSKKINVCHVSNKKSEGLKEMVSQNLLSLPHQLHIEENEDVNNGILDYVANNHVDILAIIPKKHHFFNRLFNPPHTQAISESLTVPLLALPE
jgi:nucleotide-binding universal stress UspA family protein